MIIGITNDKDGAAPEVKRLDESRDRASGLDGALQKDYEGDRHYPPRRRDRKRLPDRIRMVEGIAMQMLRRRNERDDAPRIQTGGRGDSPLDFGLHLSHVFSASLLQRPGRSLPRQAQQEQPHAQLGSSARTLGLLSDIDTLANRDIARKIIFMAVMSRSLFTRDCAHFQLPARRPPLRRSRPHDGRRSRLRSVTGRIPTPTLPISSNDSRPRVSAGLGMYY